MSSCQTLLQLAYWQQKENIKYTENKPVPVHRGMLPTIVKIWCQFHGQPDVNTWRGRFETDGTCETCYQFQQSSQHQVTFWTHRHLYHGIEVLFRQFDSALVQEERQCEFQMLRSRKITLIKKCIDQFSLLHRVWLHLLIFSPGKITRWKAMNSKFPFKGTLMQIWTSLQMFVFIWKLKKNRIQSLMNSRVIRP